ncbi:hypothetical protein EK904_004118, partial [Melospiza melodia maxima]
MSYTLLVLIANHLPESQQMRQKYSVVDSYSSSLILKSSGQQWTLFYSKGVRLLAGKAHPELKITLGGSLLPLK